MYMPVYKVYVVSCLTTTEERVAKCTKCVEVKNSRNAMRYKEKRNQI